MEILVIALLAAAVLLLAAVPGFALIKTKIVDERAIPTLSKLLLYVASPCIVVYTFAGLGEFDPATLANIGIFALICFGVNALMLGVAYLVLRKRSDKPLYRIMTVATTFSNCTFFGIPIIEALFPDIAIIGRVYSAVYAQTMNIIGWTVGSAIISRDRKYISVKKIFTSPAIIGLAVALMIYIFGIPLTFTIPGTGRIFTTLLDVITFAGRMATPISMIIMGMRLATMDIRSVFSNYRVYLTIGVKQLIFPLLAFAVLYFLPVDAGMKQVFFIISACPVASVVLNYSEKLGEGQKEAASMVLLGTMMCVVTLPVVSMLAQFLR